MRQGDNPRKTPPPASAALQARIDALEARLDSQADPLVIVPQSRLQAAAWAIAAIAGALGFWCASALLAEVARERRE